MDICLRTLPGGDVAKLIDEVAQFDANDQAMVGQLLAPDLLLAAPFPPGMNEFDAVGIGDLQNGGLR